LRVLLRVLHLRGLRLTVEALWLGVISGCMSHVVACTWYYRAFAIMRRVRCFCHCCCSWLIKYFIIFFWIICSCATPVPPTFHFCRDRAVVIVIIIKWSVLLNIT
jgi:hypothetical protein